MRGWRYESARHSLAAKGIRTYAAFRQSPKGRRRIGDEYGSYTEYTEHAVGHKDPHAAAYRKYDTEIVEMTPSEFLDLTRKAQEKSTGRSLSKEEFESSVRGDSARERRIHIARGIMQKRDVMPLPHYELDASGELRGHQEGRTRAVVAEMLGMEKIPVAKLTLRTVEQKRKDAGEDYLAKKMTKEEIQRWRKNVNMSSTELQSFMKKYGDTAGLSRQEASKEGTKSGRDSARAIIRMKSKPVAKWTEGDVEWMRRQNSFVARMRGARGSLYDEKGQPTRKLLALKVWGHDPEKRGAM